MSTLEQRLDYKIALVVGSDESLISHKSKEIEQQILAQHDQIGTNVSCFSYVEMKRNMSALYEKLVTPSLFSTAQLIIIKGAKTIDNNLMALMSQSRGTFIIIEMVEALTTSRVRELREIEPKLLVVHCEGGEVRKLISRKLDGTILATSEIIDYLAEHFKSSSGSLELELDKLLLFADAMEPPVSLAVIEGVLVKDSAASYESLLAHLSNDDWHGFDATYKLLLERGSTHATLVRVIANWFVRQLKFNLSMKYKPQELLHIIEQLTKFEVQAKSSQPSVMIDHELIRIFKLDLL